MNQFSKFCTFVVGIGLSAGIYNERHPGNIPQSGEPIQVFQTKIGIILEQTEQNSPTIEIDLTSFTQLLKNELEGYISPQSGLDNITLDLESERLFSQYYEDNTILTMIELINQYSNSLEKQNLTKNIKDIFLTTLNNSIYFYIRDQKYFVRENERSITYNKITDIIKNTIILSEQEKKNLLSQIYQVFYKGEEYPLSEKNDLDNQFFGPVSFIKK